VRFMFDEIF